MRRWRRSLIVLLLLIILVAGFLVFKFFPTHPPQLSAVSLSSNIDASRRSYGNTYNVLAGTPTTIELWGNSATLGLSYSIIADPSHGTLSAVSGSSVSYTPATNYTGPDQFSFTWSANGVDAVPATIYVYVTPAPNPSYPWQRVVSEIDTTRWAGASNFSIGNTSPSRADYLAYILRNYDAVFHGISHEINRISATNDPGNLYRARDFGFFAKAFGTTNPFDNSGTIDYSGLAVEALKNYSTYLSTTGNYLDRSSLDTLMGGVYWNQDYLNASSTASSTTRSALVNLENRFMPYLNNTDKYGSQNQSMGRAAGHFMVNQMYPGIVSPELLAVNDHVWNDWWAERDTIEDSTGYNSLWLTQMTNWLNLMDPVDRTAVVQDLGYQKFISRFVAQVSPIGALPNYGDSVGFNSEAASWISLFEWWASMVKSTNSTLASEAKWAAGQLFGWIEPKLEDLKQWGNPVYDSTRSLETTWFQMDDSISRQTPHWGSVVTGRHNVDWVRTSAEEVRLGYYGLVNSSPLFDKLILRSGWGANDLYAAVDLTPYMGHDHKAMGSIDLLVANQSVLLNGVMYNPKNLTYHNAFQVLVSGQESTINDAWAQRDNEVASVDGLTPSTDIQAVPAESEAAVDAGFSIANYAGYLGINTYRNLLMLKPNNRFDVPPLWWVADEVSSSQPQVAALGPAWHTVSVYGVQADNWINTAFPVILVPQIYENIGYLMQWTNKPQDLLLWFPPGEGTITVDNETFQNTTRLRVWNKKSDTIGPTPKLFNSVLIPHSPNPDNTDQAAKLSLVSSVGRATILKYQVSSSKTVWLGNNPAGATQTVGDWQTTAKHFIISQDGRHFNYWLTGGSLTIGGVSVASAGSAATEGNYDIPVTLVPDSNPGTPSSGSNTSTTTAVTIQTTAPAATTTQTVTAPRFSPLTALFAVYTRGAHVTQLQQMLAVDRYYTGPITGYYDDATIAAVKQFQIRYGLLDHGSPNTNGFGLSGPGTRAKLNQLYATAQTTGSNLTPAARAALVAQLQQQLLVLLQQLLVLLGQKH